MAVIVQTIKSDAKLRVALIYEGGNIRPVWFEVTDAPDRKRIVVKELCFTWAYQEGADKIINFAVWDGSDTYELSLNTRELIWRLGFDEVSSRG
ncbi:hypothetical protein OR1_01763 [Geobacter sp. OR-1]|uniref:hypothetical protein n=1 Tax=Geobacter sp. OR-1 TaxID=1266765 RepID=UPI0005443589|nr:hypothetical protein [Geobacter sp. OR-1]GAM09484.1 hypothetical protein OR1_01763 [Geobacter sp. OR-1]